MEVIKKTYFSLFMQIAKNLFKHHMFHVVESSVQQVSGNRMFDFNKQEDCAGSSVSSIDEIKQRFYIQVKPIKSDDKTCLKVPVVSNYNTNAFLNTLFNLQ